jgi:protein TonB
MDVEYMDYCLVLIDGEFRDVELDKEPEFLDNGQQGFLETFYGIIKYPAIARENGTQGTVVLEFEISELGTVNNVRILQDIGDGAGEEAKRSFELATEGVTYSPGVLNNIDRRVKKRIPIKFILPG